MFKRQNSYVQGLDPFGNVNDRMVLDQFRVSREIERATSLRVVQDCTHQRV